MYEILVSELQNDPLSRGYSAMSDQQVVESLTAVDRTVAFQRFASYRTLAAILTPVEYATAKATIAAAATGNEMALDMVKLLEIPGSEDGTGGGIDFGASGLRGFLDAVVAAEPTFATLAAKLKAVAEKQISRYEELGIPKPRASHINSARQLF